MSTELDAALLALQSATDSSTQQTAASQTLAEEVSGKMGAIDTQLTQALALAISEMDIRLSGLFNKRIVSAPAFQLDAGTLKAYTDLSVEVGGVIYSYSEGSALALPSTVTVGTDYAIYATPDGLVVSANFTTPDGYTALTSRRVGGFHYQDGVINELSLYDLKYKPDVRDPRGMVRSPASNWADIYLLNTTPDLLGTSAHGATIADGSSPPKKPALWGGDGTVQYPNFDWYTAVKVLAAYGKRPPTQPEFIALATGSVDNYKVGTDPVTTQFNASARSMIGCEGVSGVMWQWGADRYADIAALFAGYWDGSSTGALVSTWDSAPSYSNNVISARGVCDHFESC